MLDNVIVFGQNSIKFDMDKKIYIDPFKLKDAYNDADFIFITHDHYDHFSLEDINKVIKDDTILIVPSSMRDKVSKYKHVYLVKPDETYEIAGLNFETVCSYNIDKPFHPKSKGYVGYIIILNNIRYYISGDTDNIEEIRDVKCDVCFIPIGGTFTMDYNEAYDLAISINPKVVVPVHYGLIVGSMEDGLKFKDKFNNSKIDCRLLKK